MKILCLRWCILCLGVVEVTCLAEYFVPFLFLLHKTTLCVILTRPLDLSSALSALWLVRCKSLCWHRAMKKWLGIECCLLSGAYFSEEKVFLSGCSPRASCFSERRAGGSFGVQFRLTSFGLIVGLKRLFSYFALGREAQACFQPFCFLFRVLAFSYPHRRAQACFQLFCSGPGSSGMFSAILLFASGVSF